MVVEAQINARLALEQLKERAELGHLFPLKRDVKMKIVWGTGPTSSSALSTSTSSSSSSSKSKKDVDEDEHEVDEEKEDERMKQIIRMVRKEEFVYRNRDKDRDKSANSKSANSNSNSNSKSKSKSHDFQSDSESESGCGSNRNGYGNDGNDGDDRDGYGYKPLDMTLQSQLNRMESIIEESHQVSTQLGLDGPSYYSSGAVAEISAYRELYFCTEHQAMLNDNISNGVLMTPENEPLPVNTNTNTNTNIELDLCLKSNLLRAATFWRDVSDVQNVQYNPNRAPPPAGTGAAGEGCIHGPNNGPNSLGLFCSLLRKMGTDDAYELLVDVCLTTALNFYSNNEQLAVYDREKKHPSTYVMIFLMI